MTSRKIANRLTVAIFMIGSLSGCVVDHSADRRPSADSAVSSQSIANSTSAKSGPNSEQEPGATLNSAPGTSVGNVSGQPPLPSVSGISVELTSAVWNVTKGAIDTFSGVNGTTSASGLCVAVATRSVSTLSATGQALFDGHGLSCGLISIPLPSEPAGVWAVHVEFRDQGMKTSSEISKVTTG